MHLSVGRTKRSVADKDVVSVVIRLPTVVLARFSLESPLTAAALAMKSTVCRGFRSKELTPTFRGFETFLGCERDPCTTALAWPRDQHCQKPFLCRSGGGHALHNVDCTRTQSHVHALVALSVHLDVYLTHATSPFRGSTLIALLLFALSPTTLLLTRLPRSPSSSHPFPVGRSRLPHG
jgi:hypothetical protein